MTLLAKSGRKNGLAITLLLHSLDVYAASVLLFGKPKCPTSLSDAWCRFFKLKNTDNFLLNLLIACLFHDLGKASEGFQNVLQRKGEQAYRHEFLSACFILQPCIREWLAQNSSFDLQGVLAAVAGHHLKAASANHSSECKLGQYYLMTEQPATTLIAYSHPEVRQIVDKITVLLLLPPAPEAAFRDNFTKRELRIFCDEFALLNRKLTRQNKLSDLNAELSADYQQMLALKSAVIVCDSLGSAMPRMDDAYGSSQEWAKQFVSDYFPNDFLSGDWLHQTIIDARKKEIEARTGKSFFPKDFQREAALQPSRTLLLSGCGSGKTLAAWYWIESQLQTHRARRVIFLYPTRATATEGFRDYVSFAGEDASLLHGTADYDLDSMFRFDDEDDVFGSQSKDYRSEVNYETDERLFALKAWPKKVFSATVDGLLGFMSNSYQSMCMLPLLVDSILVVDEVHAFDSRMFMALQAFLRHFDLPVLCMTASLPPSRTQMLSPLLKRFPEDNQHYEELHTQMAYPRYVIAWADSEGDALAAVLEAYHAGRKILWVCNQVDRCQQIARMLESEVAETDDLLCYHSRFRLKDRKNIHETVINRFKSVELRGLMLVTTQVCEMSLDLDADLLVTDLAPIPSLIQRMGRCCRAQDAMNVKRTGQVLILEPQNEKPYEPIELEAARNFVNEMLDLNQLISQQNMDAYLSQADQNQKANAWNYTEFINSGLYSPPGKFRDENEFTVDAVLDGQDTGHYQEARKNPDTRKKKCPGYIVPVPRFLVAKGQVKRASEQLGPRLYTAPHTYYHPKFGFYKEEIADYVPQSNYVCL